MLPQALMWTSFGGLSVTAGVLRWRHKRREAPQTEKETSFIVFQRKYLSIFYLMMLADWLQGPYVYNLYQSYGFGIHDIAVLFTVGFATSGVMGVFIGAVADLYGRKKMALVYCVIYSASCVTKHFNVFNVLLVGRFLAGISTSILFSVFDTWMVHEHRKRRFRDEWLCDTNARGTFGNGLVAVGAGLISSTAVKLFGKVAPFDAAIICLSLGAVAIIFTWGENFGNERIEQIGTLTGEVKSALTALTVKPEVSLLGLVQGFFEGSMYIFVLMWTPSLPVNIDHGLLFSCFMVAMMIGSGVFSECAAFGIGMIRQLTMALVLAAISLIVPAVTFNDWYRAASFFLFEAACGVYFPSFYTLRSRIVPDHGRATILNLYRVPVNIIVVVTCVELGYWSVETLFKCCSVILVFGMMPLIWMDYKQCGQPFVFAASPYASGAGPVEQPDSFHMLLDTAETAASTATESVSPHEDSLDTSQPTLEISNNNLAVV